MTLLGLLLAADHVWSFTTAELPDMAQLVMVPDTIAPIACGDVVVVDFRYVPTGLESGVRGYTVRIRSTIPCRCIGPGNS